MREPSSGPTGRAHPYLAGPYPRAFVHRGWQLGELSGMENTLAAFRRALEEGFRYLEIDVHATSDDVVVVLHDPTLDRTTDARGAVAAQSFSRVRASLVADREPVPTLRTVLEELPDALLNIDVKADSAVWPTLRLLAEADAWDRVCLASFSDARLLWLRRAGGPKLLTSLGPRDAVALRTRAWLPRLCGGLPAGGELAQLPRYRGRLTVVDEPLVCAAHAAGKEVHVWTVNEAREMAELLDLGVDGLVTDRPDLLREVLAARGQWTGG